MSDETAPTAALDLIRADDDQATAEARQDALAVVRFYVELEAGGLPDDLIGDLTRTWLDSYLDTSTCDE